MNGNSQECKNKPEGIKKVSSCDGMGIQKWQLKQA